MESRLQDISEAIFDGNSAALISHVQSALDEQIDPGVILNEGMIAAMREVGRRYEAGEFFVPEMLLCARTMQSGLGTLKPHLQAADSKSSGRVVVGTVRGDIHDIGKNLVGLMLEGAGYEIRDLGTDVPAEDFITAIRQESPDVVALSALLTTTMWEIDKTIQAIAEAGLRDQVKIIIGGAPITDKFASQIGADGFAPDASRAVALVDALLQKEPT